MTLKSKVRVKFYLKFVLQREILSHLSPMLHMFGTMVDYGLYVTKTVRDADMALESTIKVKYINLFIDSLRFWWRMFILGTMVA